MRDRLNHSGHRGKLGANCKALRAVAGVRPRNRFALGSFPLAVAFLCVLCANNYFPQTQSAPPRNRYDIKLSLDFDNRAYTGIERVRWTNHGKHPTSSIFFYLYSNLRVPGSVSPPRPANGEQVSDEPRLEIVEVKSAKDDSALDYSLADQETILRVDLDEP